MIMKTLFKQYRKFLVLGLIFTLFTCSHDESSTEKDNGSKLTFLEKRSGENATIYYGISTELFYAYAGRSWVSVDKDGFPREIGIEYKFDSNLYDNWGFGNEQESSYTLSLPEQARALTPFEHIIISLDYPFVHNGQLSTVPHLGFRFYTISTDERAAIPAYDPEDQSIVDAFNSFPNRSKMPSDYFMFPDDIGVAQMMGKQ
jgi:hypothetical protein